MKQIKNITRFKTPQESPGYLLWQVSTSWRRSIEEALKPYGLTHPQFVILASIAWYTQDGNQVSQRMIARHVGLDPNTTSQVMRGLEKKKLLARKHTINERVKNPTVTPRGAAILNNALPAVEQADEKFFSRISSTSRKQLLISFQKLATNS